MTNQFFYFYKDVLRIVGKRAERWLIVVFTRVFWGVFLYRFERFLFLIFGKYYSFIRIPFLPFFLLIQSFSNIEIHYKANIKEGILILHSSIGVVVSGRANIGKNITFTGGNVIGFSDKYKEKKFEIGDFLTMGANAVILGPVVLSDHITVGASACVVKNFLNKYDILVGVPAKSVKYYE